MKTYEKILELARQAHELGQELADAHEYVAWGQLNQAVIHLTNAAQTREAEVDKLAKVVLNV